MQITQNVSLRAFNTFKMDVRARYFSVIQKPEEIYSLLNEPNMETLFVLGGGSNILLTKDVNGIVLKNEIGGITQENKEKDVLVRAGAGVNWHEFVLYCLQENLGGVENLALIPGSVGASPMQNIGAYGVELKDVFQELEAFHIKDKAVVKFNADDCRFAYRESIFKNKYKGQFLILNVTFRLSKIPTYNISYGAIRQELDKMHIASLSIHAIAEAVIRIRRTKLPDPSVIGNAGSFFKNLTIPTAEFEALQKQFPSIVGFKQDEYKVKLAAGWLIEQCGWKGFRKGDAGCHTLQALVLVNYGNASGKEIFDLSEEIRQSVIKKFGVELEREVNIV